MSLSGVEVELARMCRARGFYFFCRPCGMCRIKRLFEDRKVYRREAVKLCRLGKVRR